MATSQLISVKTEGATLFGRFVAFIGALVATLMQYGILTAEHGDKILGIINSPTTALVVSLIGTIVAAFGPSILGWRNKSKELPAGVTVKDVEVKATVPASGAKNVKLQEAASKLSLFVLMFLAFAALGTLTACSTSCPKPAAQTYYSTNAYPAQKQVQMRALQGQ